MAAFTCIDFKSENYALHTREKEQLLIRAVSDAVTGDARLNTL